MVKPNLMNFSEINKIVNKNQNIKLSGEKIIFSDSIIKINKKLVEQKRDLIITVKALYNFKENTLKRRIPVKSIKAITVSKASNEFVIHGEAEEYDYHYKYKKRRKIIQILANLYYNETFQKLNFALVKEEKLGGYVTVDYEKKKDKNKTKFDTKYSVDIDIYLYGNLLRKNSIRTSIRNHDLVSTTKTQKTEIIYINDNNSFKNQNEIKIENFRILGDLLSHSYYGKIIWSEYLLNNTFYIMRVINNNDIYKILSDIERITESPGFNALTLADCVFQTQDKIFMVNKFKPYYEGGFLFYHLKNAMTFNEKKIKIISAQIINIIIFFHKKIEKHMNFSPENFILDKDGFINYLWFEIDQKLFEDNCNPLILKPTEYTKINNDWYNLGVMIYEFALNLNPEKFMDNNGKIHYPCFIDLRDELKEIIEKFLSMKNENDDLNLEDIKKFKFFEEINFEDINNRKFDPEIKPMNLEMQKINNMGIITDEQIDEKEEKEKERYALFNYDSDNDNDNEENLE